MFDTHSDYSLNKLDREAIVCPCASGEHIRLTREDFSSEEEFARWKAWSDEDYHEIELGGRKDDDCLSFEAQRDTPQRKPSWPPIRPLNGQSSGGRQLNK